MYMHAYRQIRKKGRIGSLGIKYFKLCRLESECLIKKVRKATLLCAVIRAVRNWILSPQSGTHTLRSEITRAAGKVYLLSRAKLLYTEVTVNDRLLFKSISCYVIGAHSQAHDL